MFEKFAQQARRAVAAAMSEARESGTSRIGCDHLLIGLAEARSGTAADSLAAAGLDVERLRALAEPQPAADPLDPEALATVGIDLDAVRQAAESAFGPGALDRKDTARPGRSGRAGLTPDARKAVELALRATRAGHHRSISSGHLLIGIIDQGDNAAVTMLTSANVRAADVRADVVRRIAATAR
jgi:ATP-dependent Clp protease ATP-binding subunit ClpA